MAKSHKKPQKATQNELPPWFELTQERYKEDAATGKLPANCQRLPWETQAEYTCFHYFMLCPEPRSVRKAYRIYCTANGYEPKKDPPSSWYKLYRGGYRAFRKAEQRLAAIERAGKVHGRVPDWQKLEDAARVGGHLGKHHAEFGQEIGDIADRLALIEWAFWSLAIDKNGDPIPGLPTWKERSQAAWDQVERGELEPPAGWERTTTGEVVPTEEFKQRVIGAYLPQ